MTRHLIVLSALGSVAMSVASWWVAGLPAGWHTSGPMFGLFYLGLATALVCWLLLGRVLFVKTDPACSVTTAALRRFVLGSCAPLLFAAPFGRDLWAYAAQGNLVRHGIDPYTHGPSAVSGVFTEQMSQRWIDSRAPYGPLWLRISHAAVAVCHEHPTIAALLLRLPAVLGILLWLWALPRLAERLGGRLIPALWLGLASPLTIVLGFGGGHNDLLMIGLILAGLALTTGPTVRHLVIGAAVVGLAVMVKSPAAIAVAFTVPFWLHANGIDATVRSVVRACAAAIVGAGACVAALTVACGLGVGWTSQVNADAPWISWLSLPTGLVILARLVTASSPFRVLDGALKVVRSIGEALTVAACAALWFLALRRAPVACFAMALGVAAVLAPAVQPWYYCWALALAGLVVTNRRALLALATMSVAFPIMIMPSGVGMESDVRVVPVIISAAALVWFVLARGTWHAPALPADGHRADHARA
ncbi:MAG: polyprenol phosphomannose-dependent alpha 1,6 mannosyltransferase MptB [Jatrophihabitantaceae bacterium]